MGKKQTRRSISVMGATYLRLDLLAKLEDRSVSGIIEELVKARCDAAGIADVTHDQAKAEVEKRKAAGRNDGSGIFSF